MKNNSRFHINRKDIILIRNGKPVPSKKKSAQRNVAGEFKTEAYYERVLDHDVRELYSGEMDVGAFIDDQIRLIEEQFTRAWNEGMRNVGLDPQKDMKPEWQEVLDQEIENEKEFILDFAQAIQDAAAAGDPIDPLLQRVTLWTNRYPQMVSLAEITCGGKVQLRWLLGATEQHCSTCFALNGIVAAAEDWEASGYHPQGAPNEMLECGGWRCDCSLEVTEEPLTEGGIPNV